MEIPNPKRILAVSLESETQLLSQTIKDLTGSHPEPHPGTSSLAGTSHTLSLSTNYYKAEVPMWIDLISSPSEWAASFTSPEAKEVLDVLGGVVVVFSVASAGGSAAASGVPLPPLEPLELSTEAEAKEGKGGKPDESSGAGKERGGNAGATKDGNGQPSSTIASIPAELIREVGRVLEALGGWSWDGVGIGIGVGGTSGDADELDDACAAVGLEFVHAAGKEGGKNEFGEKIGMDRVLEALQANDWALVSLDMDDNEFGEFEKGRDGKKKADADDEGEEKEFDPESLDFGFDRKDFEGLKKAIWSGALEDDKGEEEHIGEEEVEKLERMMFKLQAVKDMSSGLPEEQRKQMAKKAVGEVMKEL
ncbi:Alpha and gamma adaptin binding protein p34 [Zalerion maritima]|uniref:Alpha and gamma adaptin binding protein p34 n=1 Tax=Zalerion maritima TaxID=339359 RepID=A0AAD5WSX1_9PEZI|nr:Alpha and gamma adaptin binding protein p34 [Zalerion maritima]